MPKLTSDTTLSCSQLPSVMGHSKWSTPNDTLNFCVTALDGQDPRTEAGEAADWGNLLEEKILGVMAQRLGLESWVIPEEAYAHADLPLACSLDGIGRPNGAVVIKHNPAAGIYVMDGDEIEISGDGILESKLTRGYPEDTPPCTAALCKSKAR